MGAEVAAQKCGDLAVTMRRIDLDELEQLYGQFILSSDLTDRQRQLAVDRHVLLSVLAELRHAVTLPALPMWTLHPAFRAPRNS